MLWHFLYINYELDRLQGSAIHWPCHCVLFYLGSTPLYMLDLPGCKTWFGCLHTLQFHQNYLIFSMISLLVHIKNSLVYIQHPHFPPPVSMSIITVKFPRLLPPHLTWLCPWFRTLAFVFSLTFLVSKVITNCLTFGLTS